MAAATGDLSAHDDTDGGFSTAVAGLKTRSQVPTADRVLRVAGPVMMPLGALVIVLGWLGAANTTRVFLQIPYLISGGLLGLGLIFAGGFIYFSRWVTDLTDSNRRAAAAAAETAEQTLRALERIETLLATTGIAADPTAPPSAATGLVITAKGALVHRADCRLVEGRATTPIDDVGDRSVCRICQPVR